MIKIVTIFDSNYASLGFSMMESAVKNINDEILFDIYPLDNFHDSIRKFCCSRSINFNYHDSFFKQKSILDRKKTREYSNFIFSLTPSILLESMKADNCELMIYLDADTFFFNKLDISFFKDLKKPIHLVPHQFDKKNKKLIKYGRINVGWMSFDVNNFQSTEFLKWWENKCIQSTETSDQSLKNGIFGDQLYLDHAKKFFDVEEILFSGINVAPWNFQSYLKQKPNFDIKMYHFHHLYRDKNFYYLPSLYYKRLTSKKEKVFYRDYLQTINKIQSEFNLNASLSNKRRSSSFFKRLLLYFSREMIPISKFKT